MRSKSEVLIANVLNRNGIPYRYECPLMLGNQRVYPDFTILKKNPVQEIFWEHLGLLDESDYRNSALVRIDLYEKNGIFPGDQLIITAETAKQPLNNIHISRIIQHYLINKPQSHQCKYLK